MDSKINTQTLIGGLLVALSVYSFVEVHWVDGVLYSCAGFAFIIMGVLKMKLFMDYTKMLTVASWVFIAAAIFFFLFRLMMDSLEL